MEDFKEQADGVRHIPSNYSKEMATKSSVVSYNNYKEWYSSQCVPNYSVILITTPKKNRCRKEIFVGWNVLVSILFLMHSIILVFH